MKKKYIITGSNSLIGSSILKTSPQNGIEFNERIQNYNSLLNQEYETAEIFFHCAWVGASAKDRNSEVNYENLKYLPDIIEMAKRFGVRRFIDCGSQAEINMPETAYAKAKTEFSQKAGDLCLKAGIEFCHTQIFSVYGPLSQMKDNLIKTVIMSLLKNETPKLTKCEQMWDFLYSEDCGRAFHLIAEKGKSGKTYQIGSGQERRLREYIELIRDIVNKNAELKFGEIPYFANQPMRLCADIEELKSDTGFLPKISFEDGIRSVILSL
ncbi:MAG: NAD(P)-dependent oxidoreductase [Ruminococcus sp.]|jgi:nucleoside-diphosphate-sugar epimerase|nr:NAD(P)-dependent oxidoreductase [Ruminococcus sp.]